MPAKIVAVWFFRSGRQVGTPSAWAGEHSGESGAVTQPYDCLAVIVGRVTAHDFSALRVTS